MANLETEMEEVDPVDEVLAEAGDEEIVDHLAECPNGRLNDRERRMAKELKRRLQDPSTIYLLQAGGVDSEGRQRDDGHGVSLAVTDDPAEAARWKGRIEQKADAPPVHIWEFGVGEAPQVCEEDEDGDDQ